MKTEINALEFANVAVECNFWNDHAPDLKPGGQKGEAKRGLGPSSNFGKNKKKCVLNLPTVKVCVSSIWQCLGPSAARQTLSLFLCSSGSNARGQASTLEGRPARVSSNCTWAQGSYSRLLISTPRVINRTDVEVPYLGGWLGPRFFTFVYLGYYQDLGFIHSPPQVTIKT